MDVTPPSLVWGLRPWVAFRGVWIPSVVAAIRLHACVTKLFPSGTASYCTCFAWVQPGCSSTPTMNGPLSALKRCDYQVDAVKPSLLMKTLRNILTLPIEGRLANHMLAQPWWYKCTLGGVHSYIRYSILERLYATTVWSERGLETNCIWFAYIPPSIHLHL